MRLERSLPLLGLLLCAVGTTAQQDEEEEGEFLVEISGTTVTITCPLEDDGIQWDPSGRKGDTEERKFIIKDHDSTPANVSCSLGNKKRKLYLNARVCANCEELDALTVAGIITADLLITLGVLILVYYFSKGRKGRASAGGDSRPRGPKMQRPPPVPNPDYESSSSERRKRQQSRGWGRFSPGEVNASSSSSSGAEPCARRMRFRGTAGFIYHNRPYAPSREMARYTQH